MKIAVLGSGNGGIALAADWSLHGHEVSLFDFERFSKNIEGVNEFSGIYCEGDIEGFAKIHYAGHNLEEAIEGAEIIFVVGPAYSTKPFALACKEHIKKGQTYIVCPSSMCGAIVFKKTLGIDLNNEDVVVADTSTLPYACRVTQPGKIKVFLKLKGGLYIAALPQSKSEDVYKTFSKVHSCEVAKNVMQTTLQNGNPVIHPSVTLLNAGRIESTSGDFYFYEDGVTPGVGKLMRAVDEERVAIAEKLGVKVLMDAEVGVIQGYMQEAVYETGYRNANGFKGIKAQNQLDHRYLNEDVGYGLVFMSQLAKKIDVKTPVIDSIILIASKVMDKEYDDLNILDEIGVLEFLKNEGYEV